MNKKYLDEKDYFEIKVNNVFKSIEMFKRHENDNQTKTILEFLKDDIESLKKSIEKMEKCL